MNLFRLVFFTLVVFDSALALECPTEKHLLSNVTVFDGPPEEMASLIPDSYSKNTSKWYVGYIHEANRNVYLVCEYSGKKITVTSKEKVENCIYKNRLIFCK